MCVLVCVLVWMLGCDWVVRGLEGTGEVDRDVDPDGGRWKCGLKDGLGVWLGLFDD